MADLTDQTPEDRPTEGQTIRDVLRAVQAEQRRELDLRRREIQQEKREARETRIKKRRERDQSRIEETRTSRTGALRASNEKVASQVAIASRALRTARRAATEVPFPRYTPEAREVQRIMRSLDAALGALRRIGAGTFYEADVDLDLEPMTDID